MLACLVFLAVILIPVTLEWRHELAADYRAWSAKRRRSRYYR
jgi:hypothetical protein